MNLVYGNYAHDVGEAEVSIFREGVCSELGVMYAVKERWNIQGRLHASNVSAVNAAVAALLEAYSYNGLDIYIDGSSHVMRSADTINGTRVVVPPSFPKGSGGENTTYRNYALAVEGEFPYVGNSILLSYAETLSFRGTGDEDWGYLELRNGPPQRQVFTEQTVVYARQSGTAVCVPDSIHRNDPGFYWAAPPPIWPQYEHRNRRELNKVLPSNQYGQRVTTWSYYFSADVPLAGFPNSAGVVAHLG
jgi:hypothetical protein